jgi:hypothetical protein
MAENQEFIRSSYPWSSDYFDELAGLRDLYRSSPLPNEEIIDQFALYATPASLHDSSISTSLYQNPGSPHVITFSAPW